MGKIYTTVWLTPEIHRRFREIAIRRGMKMSQLIEHVLSVYIQLEERNLWTVAEFMARGGVVNQININTVYNFGTLIEKLERIEQLISAQNAVVVKIKLSETERSALRDVINTVVDYARTLVAKRPEEAASAVVLGLQFLERVRKKILDATKMVQRRGITLEDLANSQSPDAELARRALETLRFVELAVETAKADRDRRASLANQLIATAQQLAHAHVN